LKIALLFMGMLPLGILHRLGKWVARSVFFLWKKRRNVILENLRLAFGSRLDQKEMDRLYYGFLANMGRGSMEALALRSLPDRFFHNIEVTGLDHLDEALKKGKGVIAVSAHLGNFALIGRKLSLLGYRFNYLVRNPHNRWSERMFRWLGETGGVKLIPDKPKNLCLKRSIECLKNGEILFILSDVSALSGGIDVDFFGHQVPTFKGPVTLSMRSGAALLPMFIVWDGKGGQEIIIEPSLPLMREGRLEEDIRKTTSHIAKLVEGYIEKYPAQWWWIHRRWKRRRKKETDRMTQDLSQGNLS